MKRTAITWMVALALAAGCGGRASEQQSDIGQTHLLLGNISEAEASFRAAIEANDSNAHAHLGLARCLSMSGNAVAALDSYSNAAKATDTAVAACFEAADLELLSANREGAEAWVERLLSVNLESGTILNAYLRGRVGDSEGAIALLESARNEFGNTSSSTLELAWCYAMDRNGGRAMGLHAAFADDANHSGSLAMLAAELQAQDIENAPTTNSDVAKAWEQARREEYVSAQRAAEPFTSGANGTPWANVVLGFCALSQGAPREAERLLQLASFDLPTSIIVRDLLAETRGGVKEPVAPPQPQTAIMPTAWRDLWQSARLRPLLEDRTQWGDADDVNGSLYVAGLVTGDHERAEELAMSLSAESWLKPYADAMRLAVQDREPGELLSLIDEWNPESETEIVLMRNASARAYAVAQLRARALEQILRCLVDAPENAAALYNLAVLYREAGMPSHELEAWRRLHSRHPEHGEAQERAYTLLVQLRRFAEARRAAEAAYVSNPTDPTSLIRLADASFKTGDIEFAIAALTRNVQTNPGDRTAARALARGYLAVGDGERALSALEKHSDENELSAFGLALSGRWDDAFKLSTNGDPESLLHAALLTWADQYPDAESILQRIALTQSARVLLDALSALSDSDANIGGLALTLSTRADVLPDFAMGAAYSAAGLAAPAFERWQVVSDAIGFDLDLSQLMLAELARTGALDEKALRGKQVVERHAASPKVWILLADVHASMENSTASSEALSRAALIAGDSPEIWQGIAQRVDEEDTALLLQSFQNLYRLLPDNPVVQNNFAYALLQSGESTPNPLPLAESAFKALGARSHVLHTLGLALANAGRVDDAREKLYQALEQRPGDPTLMLDFGKALIAQGETDEGRRLVQSSLTYADRLRVAFPRREEAESILVEEAA